MCFSQPLPAVHPIAPCVSPLSLGYGDSWLSFFFASLLYPSSLAPLPSSCKLSVFWACLSWGNTSVQWLPGALLFPPCPAETSCCSGFLFIPAEIFQNNSSSGFPSNTNVSRDDSRPSYDYRLSKWKTDSTRWSLTFKCGTVGLHANSKERKSLNSIEVLAKRLVETDPCLNDKEELNCCCCFIRKRKRTWMEHI